MFFLSFFFNKNVFINNNDLCSTATLKLLNLYKNAYTKTQGTQKVDKNSIKMYRYL